MKIKLAHTLALFALPTLANTPPEITNVRASQRTDTKLVDIYYDAADADGDLLKVRIEISDNDDVKYSVPAFSLTGDIGEGIAAGKDKHIVWDAGTDWDGEYSDKMRVKVYAIDAQGFPGLEWGNEVPPGGFLMGQDGGAEGSGPSRHVNIPWSYWLSKYEITAGQYCDFLNAAYTAGNIYFDGSTYVRSYGRNTFEGYCNAGVVLCKIGDDQNIRWNVNKFECTNDKTNYPAIVSYYGATAFARFYGYDLPTEAEWEKAARGPDHDDQGEHWLYPWGDSVSESYANVSRRDLMPVGYYNGNQTPVGPDTMNGYGLYDVIGNAKEWTRSAYLDSITDYPQQESLCETLNLPFRYGLSTSDNRVIRGCGNDALYIRMAEGQSGNVSLDYESTKTGDGFRLVRRHEVSDVKTIVSKTINFEWNDFSQNWIVDAYESGPYDCRQNQESFSIVEGANGTKGVLCTNAGNDTNYIEFRVSAQRVCYFTMKVKNTAGEKRSMYLSTRSLGYDRGSGPVVLSANMNDFVKLSFDGGQAVSVITIYMTSGIVIDDLEFHTLAE